MIVAVVLAAVTIAAAYEGARTDRYAEAASRAQTLAQTSQATVALGDTLEGRITDLAGLFNASDEVTAAEFSAFTEPMLDASGAASLSWIELVPARDRPAFERRTGVPIKGLDAQLRSTPAGRRTQYGVTTFTNTADGNEASLGLDVLADEAYAKAISRAKRSSSPQSTGRVTLAGGVPGFVMFVPAYGPSSLPHADRVPIGFVSAAFEFSELQGLLTPLVPRGANVHVTVNGESAARLGTLHRGVDRGNVMVAGQRWEIAVSAAPSDPQALGLSRSEAAAIFLTLLTLLITGLTRQAVVAARRSNEVAGLRQRERDQAVRQREASERSTRELLAHLPDLAVLRFDSDARFITASGGLLRRVGWQPEELEGKLADDTFDFVSGDVLTSAIRKALAGEATEFPFDGVRGAGLRYWMQALPLSDGQRPEGLLVFSDVTALIGAENARKSAERRFERAFENAPIGMALVDRHGAFVQVNEAMSEITGYSAGELASLTTADVTHPDDLHETRREMATVIAGTADDMSVERRFIHADGHEYWVALHATLLPDADGSPELVLAQVLDITDRRLFDEKLRHLADHDPLTGLHNRRSFEHRLANRLAAPLIECEGNVRRGALLMVDLDHFKAVNDTLGHHAGDAILKKAAEVFCGTLRGEDSIGRLGGDEFAILLPNADEAEARFVADKLGAQIRASCARLSGGRGPSVSASIGVALLGPELRTADDALVAADIAMYAAKTAGRGRYAVAGEGDGARPTRRPAPTAR